VYQEYGPIEGFKGPYPQYITKEYEGIPFVLLFMQPSYGHDYLNRAFNQHANYADLRIYFVTALCQPRVVNPSIAVSHGIFWDFAEHPYKLMDENQRKHFMQQQLQGFTLPDDVVAVDHNVRNVIQAIEPGAEIRIHVIPNYVDTSKFTPKEKDWKGIRVLFPRRSTLVRGWNLFSAAAKELPEYEFIACGDANNEDDQTDLEKNVTRLLPNLTQTHKKMDEMPSLYQSVDIAVIPTIGAEGLSLSQLEAQSCGLPVITSGVGGLNESIIDGYNGLKFDPNHEKLSDYIRYLAENEDVRKELGQKARETALCFDEKIWWNRWRQLIPPASEVCQPCVFDMKGEVTLLPKRMKCDKRNRLLEMRQSVDKAYPEVYAEVTP
jgi:glycosyltransferase involved in cell wall biosynthesis